MCPLLPPPHRRTAHLEHECGLLCARLRLDARHDRGRGGARRLGQGRVRDLRRLHGAPRQQQGAQVCVCVHWPRLQQVLLRRCRARRRVPALAGRPCCAPALQGRARG